MKVLQISDIHMSEKSGSFANMVIDAVKCAIEQGKDISPDILLITGDLTNRASMAEFQLAEKEIKIIKEKLSSIKECIIVPGNHDYCWIENDEIIANDKRHINYEFFKNACKETKLCENISLKTPKSLRENLNRFLISHTFIRQESFALLIIGMNSDMIDSRERAGQGYFEKDQHSACKKLIDYYEKICQKEKISIVTMCAFHHHILPVSSVERDTLKEPEKFSLTLDARRTLDFFVDNGVKIAVHGHQHQPSIVYWKDEMRKNRDGIFVVSAGSMAQDRKILGDISRNNFIIYDINEKDILVYFFQNKEEDWDIMELSRDPYLLMLKDPYTELKCNVSDNAIPPKEIILADYNDDCDTSDLYYLFLNVVDCNQARLEILKYIDDYTRNFQEIDLCGIHHLYGKYDILLKYRTVNGNLFSRNLIDHLVKSKTMHATKSCYFMNISYENKNFKQIDSIPLLTNPEAYLNSTWNMATLVVYLNRKISPDQFFKDLNILICSFNKEHNTKIEDIIRDYAIGEDQSVIFELFISCYQFPMLTCFTSLIEQIICDYGVDKSTHIIYYFDERRV